jgi:hypothetical protein
MSNYLIDKLWNQYTLDNPHVLKIHQLFTSNNNSVLNDHIAFRTINDQRVDIDLLSTPFIKDGYHKNGEYHFKIKKLYAEHFEHKDPQQPKIFISHLLIDEFSSFTRKTILKTLNSIPDALLSNPESLLTSGNSWGDPSHQTYQKLLQESEYAAWFYVFGFRANHFTVLVNALHQFNEVFEVNQFLKSQGFQLNDSGGEVKGIPDDMLEQSSTKSGKITVQFREGKYEIPCCYYEFAKRYPDQNGKLYQGFVTQSADKIFDSTNVKT